jgi:hypothetical protein
MEQNQNADGSTHPSQKASSFWTLKKKDISNETQQLFPGCGADIWRLTVTYCQ